MLILSADVGVPVRGAHQDFASLAEVIAYENANTETRMIYVRC